MEYTINELSKLAGVSSRTLRYYDAIGLLKPARINSSNYRVYSTEETDLLQQILFFRELGYSLKEISAILKAEDFDKVVSLKGHLAQLTAKKQQLEQLISTVNKTIQMEEGKLTMKDDERFLGFKTRRIEKNEEMYGKEIREKYGNSTVEESNRKLMNLSPEQYNAMTALDLEVKKELLQALRAGEAPQSETGKKIAALHRQWLAFSWSQYTPEAHKNLGQMYVADSRFTAYYDDAQPGCAAFLRDAIAAYVDSISGEES